MQSADYVHGAFSGHEVVDRAFNTDIENSRIIDGDNVPSSFLLDLGAGGNAIVKNNLLVKGATPRQATASSSMSAARQPIYGNSNVSITGTTLDSQLSPTGGIPTHTSSSATSRQRARSRSTPATTPS